MQHATAGSWAPPPVAGGAAGKEKLTAAEKQVLLHCNWSKACFSLVSVVYNGYASLGDCKHRDVCTSAH